MKKTMVIFQLIFLSLSALGCDNVDEISSSGLEDVKSVCQKSTQDNYIKSAVPHMKKAERSGGIDVYQAYAQSMAPDLETRLNGIRTQEALAIKMLDKQGIKVPDNNLEKYLSSKPTNPAADLQTYRSIILATPADLLTDTGIKSAAPFFCNSKDRCAAAAASASDEMDIRTIGGANISLGNEFSTVASDHRYLQAMEAFVSYLYQKVRDAEQGKKIQGNLYDDLVSTFEKNGNSSEDSKEMALNALGVYSTRGAAVMPLYWISKRPDSTQLVASIAMMASMISYLDGVALSQTGSPYSLPATVKSACDYTRSYHFWLAAYLAHKLVKSGYSPKESLEALHALEVIYEEGSTTLTKESPYEVTHAGIHDFYNIETQKNIAFNDAGAFWENKQKLMDAPIQIDPVFIKMYQNVRSDPPPSAFNDLLDSVGSAINRISGVKITLKWNARIRADISLDAFNSQF